MSKFLSLCSLLKIVISGDGRKVFLKIRDKKYDEVVLTSKLVIRATPTGRLVTDYVRVNFDGTTVTNRVSYRVAYAMVCKFLLGFGMPGEIDEK